MRRLLIRRVGVAAIAIAMTLVGISAASADDTTGSITGTFDDAHGIPIANASVQVFTSDQNFVSSANTDNTGTYSVGGLAPGDYIVEFETDVTQWAHGQTDPFQATVFTVTAGADIVVDETQLPIGTLTGTLTNADGSPVAGANVDASSEATGASGFATTDGNGSWTMPVFANDAYEVAFGLPNGLTQYAPGQDEQGNAQSFPVAPDQTTTIDDQVLTTGTITGRYTDAAGNPDPDAQVSIDFLDDEFANFTMTDDNGDFTATVFADSYHVNFLGSDNHLQWAFGQPTEETAAVIDVAPGGTTVVNDSQIPTGTITVSATDETTGKAIANFCASADSQVACSNGTGTAVIDGVRQGDELVSATPNNPRFFSPTDNSVIVHVTAGQNTNATLVYQRGAIIRTTIVDAKTGAPVPNACVRAFVPGFTVWQDFPGYCSNNNGVVKIAPLVASSYSLFVTAPIGSTYGDQWVGKSGGTGVEADALVVNVPDGKSVTIPPIKLDRAGTVTGQVTGPDGTGIGALVGPNAFTPGVGVSGDDVGTDSTGHYTLTNLGPYRWPLFTSADGFADQWTGGVGNRNQAQTVQVVAGASVTNNIVMSTGAPLHGKALKGDGTPIADGGLIIVYNAKTGDVMGSNFSNPDGSFSIPMEPGQAVRIQYDFFDETTQTNYDGFFGGTSEATASVVRIPASGKRIRITLVPGENL
jgi:hypothetical protein